MVSALFSPSVIKHIFVYSYEYIFLFVFITIKSKYIRCAILKWISTLEIIVHMKKVNKYLWSVKKKNKKKTGC